jgi:hypothetical protein
MMTLAIIQLAQIFVAKQVVEYAAFCGARAMLVGLKPQEAQTAAFIPLSGLCGNSTNDANGVVLPGWGSRTMSAQLYQQLQAGIAAELASIPAGPAGDEVRAQLNAEQAQLNQNYNMSQTQYLSGYGTASDPAITTVNYQVQTSPTLPGGCYTVTHNYQLRVPVGNMVAYQIGQVFLGVNSQYLTTVYNQPCLVLTASCVLPNP